jgi:SAM-dependent methyltransferase
MMTVEAMSAYDLIAKEYHWLVPDELLSGEAFVERHRDLLGSLPQGASILDCACGVGIDAVALARYGFKVYGSDDSESLVAEARKRSRQVGMEVPFMVCTWEELPRRFGERFELVLCTGNSISHCPDAEAMIRSLRAMREVLKDGGTLLLDSRNWEKLREQKPRLTVAERVVDRDGARCLPLYLWSFPARWEEPHVVEIALLFLHPDGRVTHKLKRLEYRPFRLEEVVDRLSKAGFVDIRTDYAEDADRYEIQARRSSEK